MASKRTSEEKDQGNDERDLQVPGGKRRHGYSQQEDARAAAATSEFALCLEPLLRRVIQEMIPPMLQRHLCPRCALTVNQEASTSGRSSSQLQLCFTNRLPHTIFTQSNITAEGGVALQIELRDQQSKIRDEGSSVKVQICVLNGDFEKEVWTAEEFNNQIVTQRPEKGPLLNGDTVITLKNGVAHINSKIVFTDNSSWTRTKTFRLGVKIVQYNSSGANIREGRSEPFKVLDYRGHAWKKHDRPSLKDEVWRLKKIAKGGKLHRQLSFHKIKTVKDLLQLYITNQSSLKQKIGKVAGKSWDTIIAHAKGCDIDDDKRYIYFAAESLVSLVFNCIYEVVEVIFNGQNSRPIQSLNSEEKRLVERVKQQAYNNLKDLKPIETTLALPGVQTAQYGGPDQGLQQFEFPIAQQGQPETWPTTSTSVGSDILSVFLGQLTPGAYIDDGNRLPASVSQTGPFASCFPPKNQWEQVDPFYFPYGDGAECSNHYSFPNSAGYISSKGKGKTVWSKIRAALKWVKLHVAKRNAKLFHHPY
ncbi:hypothetical protein SESBI_16861 [Sesbania bispinosa]|nr:hypothetical protein SESBI_16861 [Sesbania bispinosa]